MAIYGLVLHLAKKSGNDAAADAPRGTTATNSLALRLARKSGNEAPDDVPRGA